MSALFVIVAIWSTFTIAVCLLAMFDVEDIDEVDGPDPDAVIEDRAATVFHDARLDDDGDWLGWLAFYGVREPEDVG